jgi:hypothetical protein
MGAYLKVTAAIAKSFAESEFEKYGVLQDRIYQSDFDRLLEEKSGPSDPDYTEFKTLSGSLQKFFLNS